MKMCLGLCCRFFLPARAQFRLLPLHASLHSFGAGNDVDNDLAVVFATIGARRMRDAQLAALAARKPHARYSMVASALRRLGSISAHSDYHKAIEYRNLAKYQAVTSESSSTSAGP